jgi:hypothetical protein
MVKRCRRKKASPTSETPAANLSGDEATIKGLRVSQVPNLSGSGSISQSNLGGIYSAGSGDNSSGDLARIGMVRGPRVQEAAMKTIAVQNGVAYRLGLYDPLSEDPVHYVGRLYDGSDDDQEIMQEAIEKYNLLATMDGGNHLCLGIFPVERQSWQSAS